MYKKTARFRQGLVQKGKKLTSRNLVASDSAPQRKSFRSGLAARLDHEVENAARATQTEAESKPGLVKRRPPIDRAD
jgi:hypothetical protein